MTIEEFLNKLLFSLDKDKYENILLEFTDESDISFN